MIVVDLPITTIPIHVYRPPSGNPASPVREREKKRVPLSGTAMRRWGYAAFIIMSLLSASFYPVARPALERIDTPIFMAVQMLWLVPPALFLLMRSHGHIDRQTLRRGLIQGSCMGIALLCLTLAMSSTSITETAIFSCLNGVLVVLLAWFLFRQQVHLLTWLACLCSVAGMVVLLCVSEMHWVGDLLAFTGGILLTGYSFLIEKLCFQPDQSRVHTSSTVLGVQWLTMAGETGLYALFFGNWHAVHFLMPTDLLIFGYLSLATTLLPMLIMVTMRRYVNGITLTFLALIEPLVTACFAFFFAHERFLPLVYVGGALAIGSMVLQALASSPGIYRSLLRDQGRKWRKFLSLRKKRVTQTDDVTPPLFLEHTVSLGRRARTLLTQLRSIPEGADLLTLQRLTGVPCGQAHRLLTSLQKQGYVLSYHNTQKRNCYLLHPSWSVAQQLQEDFKLPGNVLPGNLYQI